ncbi:MAG TPA: CHAD domain-containing protein [Candidatus Sulfotelmatobacter sp.]
MSIAPERSQLAFRKTERALLKLSAGQDAESVHGFRTTSRRLETLLEEVIPDRDHHQKKLLKTLEGIRKRAGKVRDLDVQLAALRSLKVPQEPRRKTQLMHGLIELRAKHEKKLRKMLDRETLREIRKRLKRTSREVKGDDSANPLAVARTMLATVGRLAGPVNEQRLHQYRIVVKRARYAAEFAPKSAEAAQFIAQLKHLQDAVGNWHDWLTLTQTAAKRLGDANQSSLVAALHTVSGSKFRQAVAAVSSSPTIQTAGKPVTVLPEPSRKPGSKDPTRGARTETAA